MALDYPIHALFSFGGHLREVNEGDEIWTCGIRCFFGPAGPSAAPAPDFDLTTCLTALSTSLSSWYSGEGSNMAGNSTLEWCKLNQIGADGRYLDSGTTYVVDLEAPVNGGATQVVPSYLSLCISWTTGAVRGKAHHGRIYPPNYTYSMVGSAVSSEDTVSAVAAGQALLTLMNISTGLDGGTLTPAIVSPVGAAWRLITGVRVGNIYDHQSRRRNAVAETYSVGTFLS